MTDLRADQAPFETPRAAGRRVYRHRLATRIWHWVNAITVIVMIGSGLMILNAHPHLYWGQFGANLDTPWFSVSEVFEGGRVPGWLTIPSTYNLALARRWHLFFALILAFGLLAYLLVSIANRHFQRDMKFRSEELRPAHLAHDVREHLALRFHDPKRPADYNTLQKLSYVAVLFVLLPLIIATGLTMSPGINAAAPWLLDLFGGRQSARSIHFIVTMLLIGFIIVHLALVILAGVWNELRSMITGWWRLPSPEAQPVEPRP
ncbi:cytochrome b/b6 domain-containing protein [Sphingomonas japonica]|uniref:Ni/Fe-hydrogenase b-type cytochrome subunit n=1 Tax=Sphingomonas japonica TaxID=511662 RepID=A0ABX0U0F8_9SPHN|nr:cytochrome b/b6 domain-containing protein [Sphingomonas japonica]NIJ24053.1 Ni/Fe-hydrogenase b-type cytochrome subunit [Sphingomonas japonica]